MDTYEGSIYDPDSLHKYLYANGNPVKYNDPSGNFFSAVEAFVGTLILYTRKNTVISGPLQEAIDLGLIEHRFLPW